jgi:pilus biogenesis lipoprotein CpaD
LLVILGLATVSLAGCVATAPEATAPEEVGAINWQAAPRDVLLTEPRTATLTLNPGGSIGALSLSERRRLDAWLTKFGQDRPGSIHLVIRGPGSREQLHGVATVAIADGVEPQKIVLVPSPWGQRRRAAAPITITASRAVAIVPDCPGWDAQVAAPEDNAGQSGLGCADTSNLAAMIGDPAELTLGQSNPYHDGEAGALVIERYRADKVKPLPTKNPLSVVGGGGGAQTGGTPQ